MSDKDFEERLYTMFQRKLLEMWKQDKPHPEGASREWRLRTDARRWNEYVESLGGQILDWKGGMNHHGGVLLHNPCENPENFAKVGPPTPPRYILLPQETALKILALGTMP